MARDRDRPAAVQLRPRHKDDDATDIPRTLLRDTRCGSCRSSTSTATTGPSSPQNTRLWRKNLRDNDDDGAITGSTASTPTATGRRSGATTRRAPPTTFGGDTYRGTAPRPSPRCSSLIALFARLKPKFLIDYHTYGPLILYPEGWQVETTATDTPVIEALAGRDDDQPGDHGLRPGRLRRALHDQRRRHRPRVQPLRLAGLHGRAHRRQRPGAVGGTSTARTRSYTPGGFVFQDSEADVEAEFQRNLQFALDLARSARDPDRPGVAPRQRRPDFVPTTFKRSYGDPQLVEVNANRDLGPVEAHWRVDGGGRAVRADRRVQGRRALRRARASTTTSMRATDHRRPSRATRSRCGSTRGARAPSSSTVHLRRRGRQAGARARDGGRGLHAATRALRPRRRGPARSTSATTRRRWQDAGIAYDVYDVDAHSRTAPHPLGVLSHYKAVIWYTGDDLYVREPDQSARAAPATRHSSMFDDEVIAPATTSTTAARCWSPASRRSRAPGAAALQPARGRRRTRSASPTSRRAGQRRRPARPEDNCIIVSNDFIQYYLGAWTSRSRLDPTTSRRCRSRAPAACSAPAFTLNGRLGRQPGRLQTFVTTSSILPAPSSRCSTSRVRLDRLRAGPPAYDPPEGTQYAYAASIDEGYQRLRRTIDLTGHDGRPRLKFKLSYDTESDYDYVFVEAHTVGQDDWTTLPDRTGNDQRDAGARATSTGTRIHPDEPVPEPLHPHAGADGDGVCTPTPARRASGTRPPATPAASRTGRST